MDAYLDLLIESLEYDRLLAEGRDPSEVLHYKYRNVPEGVIDAVIDIDPTKKKSYSQWLLSHWGDESGVILDNLENGRIKKLFDHYHKHDDLQIKDCPSVSDGLEAFVPEADTVLVKSSAPRTLLMNRGWKEEVDSSLANDFDIVFNDDDWIIAVPNTYEAECKLGENMNWCTAGGRSDFKNGRYYYDRYLNDDGGKYYVNFDMSKGESRLGKDYPFTRYQFHFESKQFMDKEDDPVRLDEIGMPDSAKEFYSDLGYDPDDFEDLEAIAERYEEARYDNAYRLNDELVLMVWYDDEYEWTEPVAGTDYYLYGNDDRDPIVPDEIPNPYFNDVIIRNDSELCLIKASDGGVIAASEGYYHWDAVQFDDYCVLSEGVFGRRSDGTFSYVRDGMGVCDILGFRSESCERIFYNSYCTDADLKRLGRIFVEVVYQEGGYHALFALSHDGAEVVIKRDVPIGGDCYTIDEAGLVRGKFRSYRVYDADEYESDDEYLDYDLVKEFPNGDYLVSCPTAPNCYNILKSDKKTFLTDTPLEEFMYYTGHLYIFKDRGKYVVLRSSDGRQIGRYDGVGGIDKEREIIYGTNSSNGSSLADIIDGANGMVMARFGGVLDRVPINDKLLVKDIDDGEVRVFDYVKCSYCFPQLKDISKAFSYNNRNILLGSVDGSGNVIFDLETEKVLVSGFESVRVLRSSYLQVTKLSGKVNVFDAVNKTLLLSTDADGLVSFNDILKVLVYRIGERYYPYNFGIGKVLLNQSGIVFPTRFIEGNGCIACNNGKYELFFYSNGGGLKYWKNMVISGEYGNDLNPQRTPEEVIDMYNKIVGGSGVVSSADSSAPSYSVSEGFKRFVMRLAEADKLRFPKIFD